MGIFGGKPRTGGFGEVYPAPAPQAAPRRSLFGRAGNWARTRDWERVGAALRDDPSVLSDLMQGRRQDQLVALQMAEAQRAQQQRDAQFSAAKGVDDPTQRALATADPAQWLEGERTAQQARGQYQWQRQYDAENPEPVTPYQQAQLDTQRRGQDLDLLAARERAALSAATQQARPLRGPDGAQMTRIRETAEAQRGLRGLVQEFSALQAQQRTGFGAGVNPLNGGIAFDREIRGMDALAARMRGLMRPTGSGATSDFEQRIYARGAPSIDNTPDQNQVIIDGINRATQIADLRQFFYEEYAAAYGDLNGAERAFQETPEFQQLTADQDQMRSAGTGRDRPRGNIRGSSASQRERVYNPQTGRLE